MLRATAPGRQLPAFAADTGWIAAVSRPSLKDYKGHPGAIAYAAEDSCVPVVKALVEIPDLDLASADRSGLKVRDYALYAANLEMGGPASRLSC